MHKLGLSLFAAGKMLPVRYCALELELSLVNAPTDWVTGGAGNSTNFTLENVQLLYDEIVRVGQYVQKSSSKQMPHGALSYGLHDLNHAHARPEFVFVRRGACVFESQSCLPHLPGRGSGEKRLVR